MLDWAPGPDAVVVAVGALVGGVLGLVLANLALAAVFGPLWRPWWWYVGWTGLWLGGFVVLTMALARRNPPWLRLDPAGIEFAATRADPIFIPWTAVSAVAVTGRGPWTVLNVSVADVAAVVHRRRDGRPAAPPGYPQQSRFRIALGDLRDGPSVVSAVLQRRTGNAPERPPASSL
jgi:hypothetical protein